MPCSVHLCLYIPIISIEFSRPDMDLAGCAPFAVPVFHTLCKRFWPHQGMTVMIAFLDGAIWMLMSQMEMVVTFLWCVSAGPADGGKLDVLSGPYGAYVVSLRGLCAGRHSPGHGLLPGETGSVLWHWHGYSAPPSEHPRQPSSLPLSLKHDSCLTRQSDT